MTGMTEMLKRPIGWVVVLGSFGFCGWTLRAEDNVLYREAQTLEAPRETPPVPDPANRYPAYPSEARRKQWEGVVWLRLEIAADGSVERVETTGSSGRAPLDAAAVKAVRQWRFRPARSGDSPVACAIDVSILFVLKDGENARNANETGKERPNG